MSVKNSISQKDFCIFIVFLTFTSQVDDKGKILLLHNENLAQSTFKKIVFVPSGMKKSAGRVNQACLHT